VSIAGAIDAEDPELPAARRRSVIQFAIIVGCLAAASAIPLAVDWPGWGFALPLLLMLGGALALHSWWFRHYLQVLAPRPPGWYIAAAGGLGAALWCVGIASSWIGFIWAMVPALLLGDILAGRRKRYIALTVPLISAAAFAIGLVLVPASPDAALNWVSPAIGAFYLATMWTCNIERIWVLRSLANVDRSRRHAAELATARERLRLADDLHDILGHALEVVAFKSELAGRLLPPEAGKSRAEIDEVQRVAREAMSEVRGLTQERRATSLQAELAGARATLGSAGVELAVTGDPALVPQEAQDVLGRVLREAMTNLLRHASATRCSVSFSREASTAKILVVNDGVACHDERPRDAGTGLAGLERYLTEHFGRLRAASEPDGTFTVDAELPVPA
jgi:two-component system sensor histidine kinase DesK